jgi:hypothetical protein
MFFPQSERHTAYYTAFQDPKLGVASVTPTCHVRGSPMLLLPIVENYKIPDLGDILLKFGMNVM